MVYFKCKKCNKEFNRKSNFDYHINDKKKPCYVFNDKTEFNNDFFEQKIINEENNKIININQDNANIIEDIDTIKQSNFSCKFCHKILSYKSSLVRHEKFRCKIKKENDELELVKKKLNELSVENEKLKKEMVSNTKITNNNNVSNNNNNKINNGVVNNNSINVQLVQFGNENIDHIDTKEALEVYLKSTGGNIISNILKLINLNEKYPQNHNICISDLSRELVKIFDGKKFTIHKFKNIKNDILSKIINNTHKIVDKIENDKFIKKNSDVKSKIKINNVSLKLIEGYPAEDIVREEITEKDKLLKYDKKSKTESESEEERDFNLEERMRIEHLENKQIGLLEIALEKLKNELYNGKIIVSE